MLLQSKNCRMCSKNSDREENKNPRPSKNFGQSKNFGAVGKPSGVVQVFRSPAKDCRQHRRKQEHTTNTGEQHRRIVGRKAKNKTKFALYIGMISENEKYLQKMLKKICRYRNLLYLCNQKQQNKVKQ